MPGRTPRVAPAPTTMPTFSGERQLAAKLAYVMGEVGYIEKRGVNPHFRYRFVREADLKEKIAPLLSKLKIFMLADVINHERVQRGDSITTVLTVSWTFHDGETGESFTGTSVGYGDDKGDKGANKAMTAALKFFLIPTFLVVSGDDPEADASTDQRAENRNAISDDVRVETSTAEQPQRGGHSNNATRAQLDRISQLSTALALGHEGLAQTIQRTTGIRVQLPDDESARSSFLATLILGLPADAAGDIVHVLSAQQEAIQATLELEGTADAGSGY